MVSLSITKRLGILYIVYALPVFGDRRDRGYYHAHPAHPSAQRFRLAAGVQPNVHNACTTMIFFVAMPIAVWIRKLFDTADDWRTRYGVSSPQRI